MIRRGLAAAAVLLLGAAPPPRFDPVPAGAQTALVRRYVDALAARRYDAAFALLEAGERAYFRTARNFASGFVADGFAIRSYRLIGTRGNDALRVYFVRETIRLDVPDVDAPGTTTAVVPYGVAGSGARARIEDVGRPWRAYAQHAVASAAGVRVAVKKIAFYRHAIACVVTLTNVGNGGITILPYGRSVLRDDAGHVFRLIADTRTWIRTDRRLFVGARLAAGTRMTGVLSFTAPDLDDRAARYTLTLGPSVRDGATAPVSVDVTDIAVPA